MLTLKKFFELVEYTWEFGSIHIKNKEGKYIDRFEYPENFNSDEEWEKENIEMYKKYENHEVIQIGTNSVTVRAE